MARIHGETIGRRIVKSPPAGLDVQLAEELAKIHAIPRERLPFLEQGDSIARFYDELDSVGEPHPAIELGLYWVKRLPTHRKPVVVHGDWRIGNVAVGIVAVLDWEFAHLADPSRTSPGRSSAPGVSAPTTGISAGSASSTAISRATRS